MPLPASVPEDPAAGTLDGRPFRVKKALVELSGGGDRAELHDLRLFQDEAVACGALGSAKSPALDLHFLGGAGSRRPLVGSPQPTWAAAVHVPIERLSLIGHMPAWIRFDRLRFDAGEKR